MEVPKSLNYLDIQTEGDFEVVTITDRAKQELLMNGRTGSDLFHLEFRRIVILGAAAWFYICDSCKGLHPLDVDLAAPLELLYIMHTQTKNYYG